MIYKDCFSYLMLLEQGSLEGCPPWGMTNIYFQQWCTKNGIVPVNVMRASREQASQFAFDNYYVPSGSAVLLGSLNFTVFQCAYNIGNVEAIKILQGVLGIPQDGVFGPITKRTANDSQIHATIRSFLIGQNNYYKAIENVADEKWENGWHNRVSHTARIVDVVLK